MADDSAPSVNSLLPDSSYNPGSPLGRLKVEQATQILQNTGAIGSNLQTLQRLDAISIRTHGMNPNLQGRIGQQEAFLTQNVAAVMGTDNPNTGAVVQALEQQAENNAAPIVRAPGLFRLGG